MSSTRSGAFEASEPPAAPGTAGTPDSPAALPPGEARPAERAELLRLYEHGPLRAFRRRRRAMRRRRLGQLWVAFGLKLGHVVSPILLGLIYLTLFLPFGLCGRLVRPPRGWHAPAQRRTPTVDALRLQA